MKKRFKQGLNYGLKNSVETGAIIKKGKDLIIIKTVNMLTINSII